MNDKKVFINFTLIDGNGGKPLDQAYMVVEDQRIVDLGPMTTYSKTNLEEIDLKGNFVMPGLINSHVHITMEPIGDPSSLMLAESPAKTGLRGASNLIKHLSAGTTFFRDLGAGHGIDLDLRDAVNEGIIPGPEFLAAGRCLTMTGGHGWFIGHESDGEDELRKSARTELKSGANLLKIMATGGVMTKGVEPGSPQLAYEEMKVAVEEAHKAGKKTASHAQGTIGIKNAIRAGIDSIEHGIFLDQEAIDLMLEKGTYLVPTLVAPYFIVENGVEAGIPDYVVEKAQYVMGSHRESFKKAYEAGVKIAMGTDAGTPYNLHDQAPLELELMAQSGMPIMETIVASTRNSADLLGILDDYGTLEVGKFADFLVLKDNPLEDLSSLFDIDHVYKLGSRFR